MEKNLKPFVQSQFPEFVVSDHPTFKAFLEAYYEWMEQQNTGVSTNVLTAFKQLQNPGGLVANADSYRDIDETLDGFVEYFRKEVLPIAIPDNKVTDKFFIKKIRDLYLAKGTPKSFKLLFRMIYDEDIEVFETKGSILRASDSKFFSFPQAIIQVTDFVSNFDSIDLSLASILDDSDKLVSVVLSGNVISKDSEDRPIVKIKISDEYPFQAGSYYRLVDASDTTKFVVFKFLPILSSIDIIDGGALNNEGDLLVLTSTEYKKDFIVKVSAVENGKVDRVAVRRRGLFQSEGNIVSFTSAESQDGYGGNFSITKADNIGRALEIDGVAVRTGTNNNGFQAGDFQIAEVPVVNGGDWKKLPTVEIPSTSSFGFGAPYNQNNPTSGFEVTPVSDTIGKVKSLFFVDTPFFLDSDDISSSFPYKCVIQNANGLRVGQNVSFQKFVPVSPAFTDDTEALKITIDVSKVSSGFETKTLKVPYDFDSETFSWKTFDFTIDSDNGITGLTTQWLSQNKFSGTAVFTNSGSTQKAVLNLPGLSTNTFFNQLDSFHFNAITSLTANTAYTKVSVEETLTLTNTGTSSDVGAWQDTGYVAKIVGDHGNGVFGIVSSTGLAFDSERKLSELADQKYEILRLVVIDASGVTEKNANLPVQNVFIDMKRAEFKFRLNGIAATTKAFADETGFLNSPNGGVLQDNLFYSNFTYTVQTKIPVKKWRQKVKTLLHPAGTQMYAEFNSDQTATVNVNRKSLASVTKNTYGDFTFDTSLEHYSDKMNAGNVSTDNIDYTVNPFERITINQPTGYGLTADAYFEKVGIEYRQQQGDSWWDYEPLGWIDTDDSESKSTQHDDGTGLVAATKTYYSLYDGSKNTFYKKSNRIQHLNRPLLSQTQFEDDFNQTYKTYDSTNIDSDTMNTWSTDNYGAYSAIDYAPIATAEGAGLYKSTVAKRKKEIRRDYEIDLAQYMKDEKSFKYVDNGATYYGEPAFNRKWNFINSQRTINTEGWAIMGYGAAQQNNSTFKKRNLKNYSSQDYEIKYSLTKDPLSSSVYNTFDSPDYWMLTNSYKPQINTKTQVELDDSVTVNETYPDPQVSMKNRRLK